MYHEKHGIINKFVAVFVSSLMLFTSFSCRIDAENASLSVENNKNVSESEVKAFKIGSVFAALAGLCIVGAYFPVMEAKHAIDYYGVRNSRYKNFIKSFPDYTEDKQSTTFSKQEGALWDWAACLSYVMKSQKKGIELNQKDIVKKLFDKCAFFAHNRKESLPSNRYYDSKLLDSINKLADENGMTFVRDLNGLGLSPKVKEIRDRIIDFYKDNGKIPFVINDSYCYNENPFLHFVVISEIDNKGVVTVKDPAVGLSRKQPIDVFCQGYIYDNGHAKLPSLDMFTLKLRNAKD